MCHGQVIHLGKWAEEVTIVAEDMRDAGLAILSRIYDSQFLFANHQLPSSLVNYAKPIKSLRTLPNVHIL